MKRNAVIATASILTDAESDRAGQITVDRCLAAVDDAAKWKPDLLVLPEEVDCCLLPIDQRMDAGEPVPGGPVQELFALRARKHNVNIVLPIRERECSALYNTAVVINRQGEYVGKYRKTHLAPAECDEVQAGSEYPVFDLDFGRVGVMICMDIHCPEAWTILALQGADVIAHPAAWLDYTGDLMESLVKARAIDNQIHVVTSHYIEVPFLAGKNMGHSVIVDPYGRVRATTGHLPGIAAAEVDLDAAYEFWATGDLKKQYPTLKEAFLGMRRPETYGIITRPDTENDWRKEHPSLFSPE